MNTKALRSRGETVTLLILRHAHRDKPFGSQGDNGISSTGKKQAKRLARYYKHRFRAQPLLLVSSPKKRCIETLQPIAELTESEVSISPFLDEGPAIEKRIILFLKSWKDDPPPITAICSHGDWIPVALQMFLGSRQAIELDKGGWAELEWNGKDFTLRTLFQELSFMKKPKAAKAT